MNQPHEWSPLSRFDLNLFRVFEVVYRERNLTRAAGLLHLSQSAVSHALARLRDRSATRCSFARGAGLRRRRWPIDWRRASMTPSPACTAA